MTFGEAASSLLILLAALWTAGHLAWSRMVEARALRMKRDGASDEDVDMTTKRSRTLQDMSRLMPTWLLGLLVLGLVWRGALLARSMLGL